jgi:hypothetical protein
VHGVLMSPPSLTASDLTVVLSTPEVVLLLQAW